MSHTAPTAVHERTTQGHDVTIRVAKEAGHLTDPAAFATAASRAAARRNASILSAHTAEEIICVVSVPASGAQDAVAVALAVVADALKTGESGAVTQLVREPCPVSCAGLVRTSLCWNWCDRHCR